MSNASFVVGMPYKVAKHIKITVFAHVDVDDNVVTSYSHVITAERKK